MPSTNQTVVTIVTFTNANVPGSLKICKIGLTGIPTNTAFNFGLVVNGTPVTAPTILPNVSVPSGVVGAPNCTIVPSAIFFGADVTIQESVPPLNGVQAIDIQGTAIATNLPGGQAVVRIGTGESVVTFTDQIVTLTPTPTNTPTITNTPTNTATSTPTSTRTPTPVPTVSVLVCKLAGVLPAGSPLTLLAAGNAGPNQPRQITVNTTVGTSCADDGQFVSVDGFAVSSQVGIVETSPTGFQIVNCAASTASGGLICIIEGNSAVVSLPPTGGQIVRVILTNGTATPTITPTASPTVFRPPFIPPIIQGGPLPPPILPPPPPQLLPPPPVGARPPCCPPSGAAAGAAAAPVPGVPVIPEADSVLLVGIGLAAIGGYVALRRWRRERE